MSSCANANICKFEKWPRFMGCIVCYAFSLAVFAIKRLVKR